MENNTELNTTFYPKDMDNRVYRKEIDLGDLVTLAKEKWGEDVDLSLVAISAVQIQTSSIGYDKCYSIDYTDYVVIEYNP